MYANQIRETYTSTVYQAQGMVAVQADCIMERALALMIDTAPLIEPAEFARLRGELDSLGVEFSQLVPRMTPTHSHRAVA